MNGVLAGLVAITAGADLATPATASLIGAIGGLTYFAGDRLMLRWGLDDAVSAVPVHGAAGAAGVILVAVFAPQSHLDAMAVGLESPFSRTHFILVQIMGAGVCFLWSFLLGWLVWTLIKRVAPLRVSVDEELLGLNYSEHQVKSPVEDAVVYLRARSQRDNTVRPDTLEGSEMARLLAVVEHWAERIEKDRDEVEQVRGWLNQDADRIYTLIQRCHEESGLQTKRLETVARKVDRVSSELKKAEGSKPLAEEVLESVTEKLAELQAGHQNQAYYWDQLRNLGSSLFKNTRTLPSASSAAGAA
jgi:Amt family ammonium transporter